jgi:peroxiredoxin Q/BCP
LEFISDRDFVWLYLCSVKRLISALLSKISLSDHTSRLKAGDVVPNINGIDQDANKISLEQFRGKKIVLYFYPKDDTLSCTVEACDLRDHYSELLKAGYVVLGVSPDNHESHKRFREKYHLQFPLIADMDLAISKAYDVWADKKFLWKKFTGMVRTTFVIDAEGKIEKVIHDVECGHHARQILTA